MSFSPEESALVGSEGEKLAAKFLRKNGFKILRRNWRARLGEIDIIAEDDGALVFVEVKCRSSDQWGEPAEAVSKSKQKSLYLAAREYVERNRIAEIPLRFDVISVLLPPDSDPQIQHFKDAFSVMWHRRLS